MGKFVRPKAEEIAFEPHPGAQEAFLACPAYECLLEGPRGGGKTAVLLADFLQDVGIGLGADWKGYLFRTEFTQLTDAINKSHQMFPKVFPGAIYNSTEHLWNFPDGEKYYFRYIRTPEDFDKYQGHEMQHISFEETTNWATDECYRLMLTCNRSPNPKVNLRIRGTCNPSGCGHAWVRRRFIDVAPSGVIYKDPETQKSRAHIFAPLSENLTLLKSNPDYLNTLILACQDDPVKYKAWILGSWDIVAGGFFADLWEPEIHIIKTFPFPSSWRISRSFDWGSSSPWAVSYVAECNGEQPDDDVREQYKLPYFPKGSAVVINEIYGWNGTVNQGDKATSQEMAERILTLDKSIEREYKCKVYPGPADLQIWEVRDGTSLATNMSTYGLWWTRAYKGSGSRVAGWSLIRTMLGAAKRNEPENPHLYFFEEARHHIRTIPEMQHDKKKPEDISTDSDDHCFIYDTEIITDNGIRKIGDLVGTEGTVLTVNGKFTDYYNCRLIANSNKLIRLTFEDGHEVTCTTDHKFLTTDGWKCAESLEEDDLCIVSKYGEKDNFIIKLKSRIILDQKQPVYCLTVPETNSFALANGVIVSNCLDSLRYNLSKRFNNFTQRKVNI